MFLILNVLKCVNVVWNNFRKVFFLFIVMYWLIFVVVFLYFYGELLVIVFINIVYRVRFGLVFLSVVVNCGSSNLWEIWEGLGWGRGGRGLDGRF